MLTDPGGPNLSELGPLGLSLLRVFLCEHQDFLQTLLESHWEWSWDLFSCLGVVAELSPEDAIPGFLRGALQVLDGWGRVTALRGSGNV